MKSGVVYLVESGDLKLESFRGTTPLPNEHRFDELTHALDVTETVSLPDGREAQLGRAAIEDLSETENIRITDDEITEYTTDEKVRRYTEFLYLPGSFLSIDSSAGSFAIDLINQHTAVTATPIRIDLDSLLEAKIDENNDLDVWKVGFYGRHGLADNGVVHGSSLLDDEDLGDILGVTSKNQLGLDYTYNSLNTRIFLAESGWTEIYQPNNFTSSQYAEFIDDEILPHLVPE